jgi:hypothetical protein
MRRLGERVTLLRLTQAVFMSLLWLAPLATQLAAQPAPSTSSPVFEFLQPTNLAVYSTLDEIPIMLRALIPDDSVHSADVFADQQKIATVSFCCAACPCAFPLPGTETILQIPAPHPRTRLWMGWTNVHAGDYRLTARALTEGGKTVEATPVSITVLDLTLRINLSQDGTVVLVIPQGSLVPGGYDAEASDDLKTWTWLGPFSPGNVAAFYWDRTEPLQPSRFYRSVRVPPERP